MPNWDRSLACFAALAPEPAAQTVPARFTEFVARLGITLSPGQRALTLVAYDGLEPRDLPQELHDVAVQIFGPIEVIPKKARRVLVAVCGARAGKSYLLCAVRLLHLALTVSLATLAAGEQGLGLIVGPNLKLAGQCFRYIAGLCEHTPWLRSMLDGDPLKESLVLKREDGKTVRIECLAATAGGASLRGRSLVGAVLDECAFFRDENYAVNDAELYRAVTVRILPGGQTILASTPWAEAGLLYDEFTANHGKPERVIAAHAPTLLLRNTPELKEIIDGERQRDPVNASREYDARFMTAGAGLFFDSGALLRAKDETLALPVKPVETCALALAWDFALVSDCAAGVLVERTAAGIRPVEIIELKPDGEPLKPSEVFETAASQAKRAGVREIVGDQYYAEAAKEALWKHGIVFVPTPAGQSGKAEMFTTARLALNAERLKLPSDPRVYQQMKEVQGRPTPGGGLSISQPRKPGGGHGDIASALVAAVWHVERLAIPDAAEVKPSDPVDAAAQDWERRIQRGMERDAMRERFNDLPDEFLPPWMRNG